MSAVDEGPAEPRPRGAGIRRLGQIVAQRSDLVAQIRDPLRRPLRVQGRGKRQGDGKDKGEDTDHTRDFQVGMLLAKVSSKHLFCNPLGIPCDRRDTGRDER